MSCTRCWSATSAPRLPRCRTTSALARSPAESTMDVSFLTAAISGAAAPAAPSAAANDGDLLLQRTLVSAFLENVPDSVYFKDKESRFIAVSRSKALRHGLTAAELVGKSDADF